MKLNGNVPVNRLPANRLISISILVLLLFSACSVTNQVNQAKQLSQCNFEIKEIEDIHLAGIPLQEGMKQSDLNAGQMMQLAGSIFMGKLPLDMNVSLMVKNPNKKAAAINKLDYNILLDGHELITGNLIEPVFIPASDSAIVKIPVGTDLYSILSGESSDAVINLGFKLTGHESREAEVEVRVKPYIKIGSRDLPYPGYIVLKEKL
ncbi:MAG: LEA type 2 family protein [Bacteroidales bacterium]|jgi:hypothetical protein